MLEAPPFGTDTDDTQDRSPPQRSESAEKCVDSFAGVEVRDTQNSRMAFDDHCFSQASPPGIEIDQLRHDEDLVARHTIESGDPLGRIDTGRDDSIAAAYMSSFEARKNGKLDLACASLVSRLVC